MSVDSKIQSFNTASDFTTLPVLGAGLGALGGYLYNKYKVISVTDQHNYSRYGALGGFALGVYLTFQAFIQEINRNNSDYQSIQNPETLTGIERSKYRSWKVINFAKNIYEKPVPKAIIDISSAVIKGGIGELVQTRLLPNPLAPPYFGWSLNVARVAIPFAFQLVSFIGLKVLEATGTKQKAIETTQKIQNWADEHFSRLAGVRTLKELKSYHVNGKELLACRKEKDEGKYLPEPVFNEPALSSLELLREVSLDAIKNIANQFLSYKVAIKISENAGHKFSDNTKKFFNLLPIPLFLFNLYSNYQAAKFEDEDIQDSRFLRITPIQKTEVPSVQASSNERRKSKSVMLP